MSDLIRRTQALIDNPQFRVTDTVARLLLERIAELGSNILMLEQYNGSVDSLIKDIKAHNLEQQAKALSDARNDFTYSSDAICVDVDDLDKRIEKLQGQAKALKEKGNE
jgi:hypothetical protein